MELCSDAVLPWGHAAPAWHAVASASLVASSVAVGWDQNIWVIRILDLARVASIWIMSSPFGWEMGMIMGKTWILALLKLSRMSRCVG